MIASVDKIYDKKKPDMYHINIMTKDFRKILLFPNSILELDEMYSQMNRYAFPGKYSTIPFCYYYKLKH
jgi:hypothetical protein